MDTKRGSIVLMVTEPAGQSPGLKSEQPDSSRPWVCSPLPLHLSLPSFGVLEKPRGLQFVTQTFVTRVASPYLVRG